MVMDAAAPSVIGTKAPTGCGPLRPTTGTDLKPLRQQVFETVRAKGRIARAEITRSLGVSAGSITALTAELIAAGLLREVEEPRRETGRGRPPVSLEVVPESRFVVGIKLAEDRHNAVLCDFAGTIRAEATLSTPARRRSAEEIVAEAQRLVADLLGAGDVGPGDISTIGLGISGIVEHETGSVRWSPLLSDADVGLASLLEASLGCPVRIDNDANVLTLAELWFGAGREMTNFAVVTIEEGVGMGLVLDNALFRGGRGMGLELGHIKVQFDGALCRCGQRGCLEAYIADYALAREASTALDPDLHGGETHDMLQTLFEEAKRGDDGARTIFRRAGRYLAVGLANVIQLFDPRLIILSGERMQYDYLYADEVLADMQRLTLSGARAPTRVEIHAWGDLVWARGAAALALSALTDQVLGGTSAA